MGRYDFRPTRVHQLASQFRETAKNVPPMPWFDVVSRIPPSQCIVRTPPLPHQIQKRKRIKTKKPSRLFQPQVISYEEDTLRREFFGDHPWELARPRMVIENDGKDSHKTDWSRIRQPYTALTGENVVQRQLWIRQQNPSISRATAYDIARKEFYEYRLTEDTERRVAKEEALHNGAQFGPSVMEIGLHLEDKEYERWRAWAGRETELMEQREAAVYTGTESGDVGDASAEEDLEALEEIKDAMPPAPAAGGAPMIS